MAERYYARSASDRTDDWPYWFIADSKLGGLNVTGPFMRDNYDVDLKGYTLMNRAAAESIVSHFYSRA